MQLFPSSSVPTGQKTERRHYCNFGLSMEDLGIYSPASSLILIWRLYQDMHHFHHSSAPSNMEDVLSNFHTNQSYSRGALAPSSIHCSACCNGFQQNPSVIFIRSISSDSCPGTQVEAEFRRQPSRMGWVSAFIGRNRRWFPIMCKRCEYCCLSKTRQNASITDMAYLHRTWLLTVERIPMSSHQS
jgi:hypothetical protein